MATRKKRATKRRKRPGLLTRYRDEMTRLGIKVEKVRSKLQDEILRQAGAAAKADAKNRR